MALPNEALQKLALEIESQATAAQRDINVVKTAIASKQRDIRMLELTATEVRAAQGPVKLYEGVGKMFVCETPATVQDKLARQVTEMQSDVQNLNKKLHYLETTHKNSREHIDKIIGSTRAK